MSNKKITMLKLKRILQLLAAGVSQREISNKVEISRSSITAYKDRADLSGKSYQELLLMSDSDVVALLQRKDYRLGKDARYDMLEPLLKEYSRDITQNIPIGSVHGKGIRPLMRQQMNYKLCYNV